MSKLAKILAIVILIVAEVCNKNCRHSSSILWKDYG